MFTFTEINEYIFSLLFSALCRRLFWVDAYNKTIESSDVNGQNRRLVMFEPLLGLISEQGEYLFRHKGVGSTCQNKQGNRKHENYMGVSRRGVGGQSTPPLFAKTLGF